MAQSVVIEVDKTDRGVGLQNFKYPLGHEEQCRLVRDINPQAYEHFSAHIPMPKQRFEVSLLFMMVRPAY